MKSMGYGSLVAGGLALAIGLYGNVETAPNYDAVRARNMDGNAVSTFERAWEQELIETMFNQSIATWALGLLALVVGIIAVRKGAKVGAVGIIAGLVGAVLGAMLIR